MFLYLYRDSFVELDVLQCEHQLVFYTFRGLLITPLHPELAYSFQILIRMEARDGLRDLLNPVDEKEKNYQINII